MDDILWYFATLFAVYHNRFRVLSVIALTSLLETPMISKHSRGNHLAQECEVKFWVVYCHVEVEQKFVKCDCGKEIAESFFLAALCHCSIGLYVTIFVYNLQIFKNNTSKGFASLNQIFITFFCDDTEHL